MMFPHIDFSVVTGLGGGIIGAAGVFRTAKINGLKSDVESVSRHLAELTAKCAALEVRCQTLVDSLDRAERKVVEHYTARINVLEENRALNKDLSSRDETIADLQRQVIELQKNALRLAS